MYQIRIGVGDIRSKPMFESERETQVVFGERFELLERGEAYSLIQTEEHVRGYIKTRIITDYTEKKYKLRRFHSNSEIKLPFGSYVSTEEVEKYGIPDRKLVKISKNDFSICELSKEFIGVPYLWGGTSEFGYDCSGFVQRLYKFNGIKIPRNSGSQRDFTDTVETFDDAKPEDLVFFKGHVGLYLGDGNMIHANGNLASVSINNLFDGSEYSKSLHRIFEKIGRVNKSL
jgi:cell wall-associated NlpC family hydrolase